MHHFQYRDNELFCEDVPLAKIAAEIGTPTYVYSYATLERHYRVFDEALKTLATAEAFDHNIAQIYLNRGGVYELQGDLPAAIQQYQEALRLEPSNHTAREALRRLGR